MEDGVAVILSGMFDGIPGIAGTGLAAVVLVLAGFFTIKAYWRLSGNKAFHSYQQGVVAPVQYGERGPEVAVDGFSRRLDAMVEAEEAYDMAKLVPQSRDLEVVRRSRFRTAPVLEAKDVGVLALIEDVVRELDCGFRVLLNTSLERLVDMKAKRARAAQIRLSMAGVVLKYAVVNQYGQLVMAVEHMDDTPLDRQGHINRKVVIEVLRKAGVWYVEIPARYSYTNARAQIAAVLRGKAAVQHHSEDVA